MKTHPFRRSALRLQALALSFGLGLAPAWAGPGHDHGDEPAVPRPAAAPQRLPDGRVALPKPAQRQLGLRTRPVTSASHPLSVTLHALVAADPEAAARVQALNAGRIQPGPRGLPGPGQAVRRGEVLAHVLSSASPLERAGQAAQLAELDAARALAERRLARVRELADTVPRREIEALELELQGLDARRSAARRGLEAREALIAPVDGVIASAAVFSGQVVDARELVFEIVDPRRLRLEALSHDPALAARVVGARIEWGGQARTLRYLGAAPRLREQALPLYFRLDEPAGAPLALGQLLPLQVQTRERVQGLALPSAALVRNPANQTIVWVKTAPEQFAPRTVVVEPLDGATVVVTRGLEEGDRVVVQGATLLNQIR